MFERELEAIVDLQQIRWEGKFMAILKVLYSCLSS
jgi:hypothetical protein